MTSDNDRTGMLLSDLLSHGWRVAIEPDGDGVIVTLRRLRAGIQGGCEAFEFDGADLTEVLERACRAVANHPAENRT